jgi:hypothetical protein
MTPDAPPPAPAPAAAGRPARLILSYTPDGPLGGTFACMQCAAQAWQPDLIDHAPGCAQAPAPAAGHGAAAGPGAA